MDVAKYSLNKMATLIYTSVTSDISTHFKGELSNEVDIPPIVMEDLTQYPADSYEYAYREMNFLISRDAFTGGYSAYFRDHLEEVRKLKNLECCSGEWCGFSYANYMQAYPKLYLFRKVEDKEVYTTHTMVLNDCLELINSII
jgi:hypothetical protein